VYDEKTETWLFSVMDIIQVLTQQPDYQTARNPDQPIPWAGVS
jgi:DNA-damage-inducible protein D